MARVEITEDILRSQARKEAFELGRLLADRGAVSTVTVAGTRVGGRVDDVAVALHVTASGIAADCAHAESARPPAGLCAHAVAVALTWLRSGTDRPAPDLQAVLRTKDAAWLAARLAELAAGDPALAARLLEAAGGPAAPDLHALRKDLEAAVAEMAADRGDGYHDDYIEWYLDTEELEEVLDDIEDHLEQAPDAVAELAEHAIGLLEEVLDDGCYGSDLPDALARAADLHLDACLAGAPDPAALAERLLRRALRSGWGTFDDLTGYADVLGPEGLAHYAELLEREKLMASDESRPADSRLRDLEETLARARGGTDAVVQLLARTATRSWDFVRIAETLVHDGRDDDALEWIAKGLSGDPADPRLLSLALDCHRRAGRRADALEVLWTRFTTAPSMQTFLDLTGEAGEDASRSTRAVAWLRARCTDHAGLLVQILLRHDDVPGAWDIVQHHRVHHELGMRVVKAYGQTNPEAAIPIHQDLAETHVRRGSRPGYQDAITHLHTARNLAGRCGREIEFADFVAQLRAAHPGKKVLLQELDRAGFRTPA